MAAFKDNVATALAYKPLQYLLVIFGLGLAVYLLGSAAGKRSATGKQAKYPPGESVPTSWVQYEAPGIIKSLGTYLLGISVRTAYKAAALKPLLTLSDSQLVYIYNAYNTLNHPGSPDQSLYRDIQDDYFGSDFFEEGQIRTKTLERMLGLNLT